MSKEEAFVEEEGWPRYCEKRGGFTLKTINKEGVFSPYEVLVPPENSGWGDKNIREALLELQKALEYACSEMQQYRVLHEKAEPK